MSGFAGVRKSLTAGLVMAVAGVGVAQASGAHAEAKYQNGGLGWAVGDPSWQAQNPDGSGLRTVTPSGGGFDAKADPIWNMAYSHDGTHVAFLAGDQAKSNLRLWVSNADGTGARMVSDTVVGSSESLVWAPDDSAVYYDSASPTSTANSQIFVAPIDGSAPRPLFAKPTGFDDDSPTVSADGRVAFTRSKPGTPPLQNMGIYVLAPGASTPQLIPGTQGAGVPDFSPDGSKLTALTVSPPASPESDAYVFHLWVMNADGSGAVEVYQSLDIKHPTWSPDGTEIGFWGGSGLELIAPTPGSEPKTVSAPALKVGDEVSWLAGKSNVRPRPVLDRVGGADRRGTAIAASQWSYDSVGIGGRQADVAVLSRDDQFADALSGNALAAEKHGPLLLTGTAALDGNVKAELKRILAPGSTVYILGGTQALSPAVEQAVKNAGFTPKRLQGADRFSTSVAIAKEIAPNGPHSALVATGTLFPDALTAGAAAAQDLAGGVVLLSQDGVLPKATKDYLAGIDPHQTTVYGVGGQGVAALKSGFPAWDGLTVPLAGADRYATAYQVSHSKLFGRDKPVSIAGIATGSLWPDALSGGALIAAQHGPLLLAGPDGLSADESSVLTTDHLSGLAVFGGTKAVSDSIADAAGNAAFGAGTWDSAVNRQAPALP